MICVARRSVQILLVEDNPEEVLLTQETFKDAKVPNEVSVATDGEQALAFVRREGDFADAPRPDLILLDLNLPRMDGREVLAEIKSDPDLRRIPVVILSGSSAEEDLVRAYDLHANCYVVKPVGAEEFAKIVKSIPTFWLSIVALPVG